jgi:hypothetical protein
MLYCECKKGGIANASILYEVPHQAGNEGHQKHNYEKWKASNPRHVPGVRDKDVQNRKELELTP